MASNILWHLWWNMLFEHQLLSRISLGNFGKLRNGEKFGGSSEPPFFRFRNLRPRRLFRFEELFFRLESSLERLLEFFCERALLDRVLDDWVRRSVPSMVWNLAAFLWLRTLSSPSSPLSRSCNSKWNYSNQFALNYSNLIY